MTCLKSGTHNILKWQICYSVFIPFTWLRKWPLLLFIAAICWSNSFQCNQVRNLFFFFFGGLVFFFHLFCSVFNYYCLWNLIPGFQISEWDKPFSHSYNGCLKNSLFACLQVVKKKKKINQPKPNLWTGEHSVKEVEWLIWSLLTMLCPGQQRILIKRSVSMRLGFQTHWELKYSKSLLKKRKTTYYSLG